MKAEDAIKERRLREDLATIGLKQDLAPDLFMEVLYALYPPVHEQRTPLFGAMTLTPYLEAVGKARFVQTRLPFLPGCLAPLWSEKDEGVMRQVCDGQRSFLLRQADASGIVLGMNERPDELRLTRLQASDGITTVQRTGDGKVRIFLPEFIAVHDKNQWSLKPYSDVMVWPVAEVVAEATGQRILDLAVHVLSASNVGATIVWAHESDYRKSLALDRTMAEEIAPLSLHDDATFSLVRSIAAQNDRAMVVSREGDLCSIGVTLAAPGVPDSVKTDGGMRHNSAIKASACDRGCLFIVASADGPVSVFYDGRKIASFKRAAWIAPCRDCHGAGAVEQPLPEQEPASPEDPPDKVPCDRCGGSGSTWSNGPIMSGMPRRRRPRRSRPPRLFPLNTLDSHPRTTS